MSSVSDEILKLLFEASVNAVQPSSLIKNEVAVRGRYLTVRNKHYELKKPVRVIGFGKAVLGMAIALERILGAHLQRAVLSIPCGLFNSKINYDKFKLSENSKIQYLEGAENNLPDENSMNAALKIKHFVQESDVDDIILVLISGGGSALLPLPKGQITLYEKQDLIRNLGNCGADIYEMNCVRKELSELKGGGLAKICYPASVVTLILSDVIGDPLDIIASGPTCVNGDNTKKAIDILNKYSLYENISESIKQVLRENSNITSKHISIKEQKFVHVDNFIIGNNHIAAIAAVQKAKEMSFQNIILSTKIRGDVEDISRVYARIARTFADFRNNMKTKDDIIRDIQKVNTQLNCFDEKKIFGEVENFSSNQDICLFVAGEPTVVVTGDGLGGRNQQLALSMSVELNKLENQSNAVEISFLSCGTDGIDGPTDAAGAIGYNMLVRDSVAENLKPEPFLKRNDCYNFFSKFQGGRYLVKTGHTGTNVMDIHVILIRK